MGLGCSLHDWNIQKWVTSTTAPLLNEILPDSQWMFLQMEVAMVTAQFCMEHTLIINPYTFIYNNLEQIFPASFKKRPTRIVLKENAVFVPGQSDEPVALRAIRLGWTSEAL